MGREEDGREEEDREGCLGGVGGPDPGAAEGPREVHPPGAHDDQAEEEEGDEGGEADGLREDGAREGEARKDGGEVLHEEVAQGPVLSVDPSDRWQHYSCEEPPALIGCCTHVALRLGELRCALCAGSGVWMGPHSSSSVGCMGGTSSVM